MADTSEVILHEKIKNSNMSKNFKNFGEDLLNELAINSQISCKEIFMLRTYCAYIFQNKFKIHDQRFVKESLIKHIDITKLIVKFFHSLFDPKTNYISKNIEKEILQKIDKVKTSSPDEAEPLKKIMDLMHSTLRTNFYQKDKNGNEKDYVSIKINTLNIKDAAKPLPQGEIFVFSNYMEGCRLRAAAVARGGLRWSEREDFRTEILALMRAQKMKNILIVPDGAKGGFILKNTKPDQSKEKILELGVNAYKTFLRGLLDVTDNIIDGKVVKPKDVICRDGDDTYLVVAADRGTGDFSDIANELAKEYNFWLGDAFASGGSAGYSHKKLAVTSNTTWTSIIEHFAAINIDPTDDVFTTIAIGSMAGDVCGNGLLFSDKMKLIAAFSSKYIFIDPNPDHEKSFKERERLFNLPGSNWIDYNSELISQGGGVFSRKAANISLSPEMKKLFKLDLETISPDELIKNILKLDVDLLFNGGLGTYVKAEKETHDQIKDASTESVRINAQDLRCKVVGEGGNLGFTQAARIEYALNGGRINTDFIDNAGGVDCSDQEVNFKITLQSLLNSGKITEDARIKRLKDMTGFVSDAVVFNTAEQNVALSCAIEEMSDSVDEFIKLISILEEKTSLERKFESLPSDAEIKRRNEDKKPGLLRPELCVLLSYSKRAAYQDLLAYADESFLTDFCENILLEYFPDEIYDVFKDEISNHPLKKEICITKLASNIIDQTGLYFFHNAQESLSTTPAMLAKAYIKTVNDPDVMRLSGEAIYEFDYKTRLRLYTELQERIRSDISRLLQPHS